MAYTTINNPKNYFDVTTWTADETSPRSITGFNHQPDFLWGGHEGSASLNPNIVDSSRGGNKNLTSATNAAEDAGSHGIIDSFDSDGITFSNGTNGTYPRLYYNETDPFGAGGSSYVYWHWLVNGGTTSSNTDGTITTTLQVNQTSGMSIALWTGNGSSGSTIGHGLGSAPDVSIIKQRNASNGWNVWHRGYDNGDPDSFTELHSDAGTYANQGVNGTYTTAPGTNTCTLTGYGQVNGSGNTYVGYFFRSIKGFSKFGSYTGNNSADGPFIHCGFKPSWVLIKRTAGAGSWRVYDYKRDTKNPRTRRMLIDASSLSSNESLMDWVSNGIKIRRGADAAVNANGEKYIYMAFAQNPFVSSTGTPVTAE